MLKKLRILFVAIICLFSYLLAAQSPTLFVEAISITGNSKTKAYVIFRECPIEVGDSIPRAELQEYLAFAEQRIMGSGLFVSTKINIPHWDVENGCVVLDIVVEENWYYYIFPIFELADRNFNVWWHDQNRSLDRINYGAEGKIRNFTGHNDNLQVTAQTGYNNKWGLSYTRPFLGEKTNFGFEVKAFMREYKEANYATAEDKQVFLNFEEREELARVNHDVRLGLFYRKGVYLRSSLHLSYRMDRFNQVLDSLNPRLATGDDNQQQFFSLDYVFQLDRRDVFQYPLSGEFFQFEIRKMGLGIYDDVNMLPVRGTMILYRKLSPKVSLNTRQTLSFNLLDQPIPYQFSRGLGFGAQLVRGYDRFTVEGEHFWVGSVEANRLLFSKNIKLGKLMPIKAFKNIPIRAYMALFVDSGFVWAKNPNPSNRLPNTLLLSTGTSLDFVVYNDFVFKFYYAMDKEGRTGLFLNFDYLF